MADKQVADLSMDALRQLTRRGEEIEAYLAPAGGDGERTTRQILDSIRRNR